MATAASTSKRAPVHGPVKTVAELEQQWAAKPRPRGHRKLWIGLGVGAVLLWFAPWLVVHSPLRGWAVKRAAAGLKGDVTVGWMSVGWMSSIELGDIEVHDEAGQLVLAASHLTLSKSPLGLLRNHTDLGSLVVEQPQVHLTLRSDGSNLEDVLQNYLSGPSSSTNTAVSVEFKDGALALRDGGGEPWQLSNLQMSLVMTADSSLPKDVHLSGDIKSDAHSGRFSTVIEPADAAQPAGARHVKLQSESLPLAVLQPLVRRYLPEAQLAGRLHCDLDGHVSGDSLATLDAALEGQLAAEELVVAGPFAAGDQLRLSRLQLPLKVACREQRLQIERTSLDCDLGQFKLQGSLPLSGLTLDRLLHETYAADGELDLARLAQMLPHTMHVRDGLQLNSGSLSFAVDSRAAAGGHRWQAQVQTSALTALDAGRPVRWDNPLVASLAAHSSGGAPIIDSLQCKSSFLAIQAAGTSDKLEASATCDLNRLAADLGQFIDFGGLKMAGSAVGICKWERHAGDLFTADGSLQLQNMQLVKPGKLPWNEQQLVVFFTAGGQLKDTTLTRCDKLTIDMQAGNERAWIELVQPATIGNAAPWQFRTGAQGSLANWAPRLQPWVSLDGWALDGLADLKATAAYSPAGVEITEAQLTINRLHAWGSGMFIDDPSVLVQTAGRYDNASGSLKLGKTVLNATALNLECDNFLLDATDQAGARVSGDVRLQGDANRLFGWFSDPRKPAAWQAVGRLDGKLNFRNDATALAAALDATVDEFALYDGVAVANSRGAAVQPVWRERQIKLAAEAAYDAKTDGIRLTRGELAATALRVQTSGKLERLSTTCDVDLTGQLDYDLPTVSRLLQPVWGAGIQFAGQESRKFAFRGPLANTAKPGAVQSLAAWLQPLSAQASLGWGSASIYGLTIGRGALDASLAGGALDVKPLDFPVGDGRLTFAPKFLLAPEPASMTLPAGQLLKEVTITPEVCATGLKFIAPALADATRSEGKFSVTLAGGRFPLSDPSGGQVSGQLQVHSVRVLPGPTSQSLVGFVRQLKATLQRKAAPADADQRPLLLLADQAVDFKLVDRRVYHSNLTMQAGEFTIRTHGSVGLDETISLVAEIPVPADWATNIPGLAGQVISLPIDGTLKSPRLDPRVFDQLAAQFLQNAARGAIQDGVNKQLDKLFRPR